MVRSASLPLPACLLGLNLALVACSQGEQGFGTTDEPTNEDEGTAAMEIDPAVVVIDEVAYEGDPPVSKAGSFTIRSVGDGTLRLYDVDLANTAGGVLYMEPYDDTLNLAAGVEREFTVVATLNANEAVTGKIRVQSNDGEQQLVEIPVEVYPIGWVADTGR